MVLAQQCVRRVALVRGKGSNGVSGPKRSSTGPNRAEGSRPPGALCAARFLRRPPLLHVLHRAFTQAPGAEVGLVIIGFFAWVHCRPSKFLAPLLDRYGSGFGRFWGKKARVDHARPARHLRLDGGVGLPPRRTESQDHRFFAVLLAFWTTTLESLPWVADELAPARRSGADRRCQPVGVSHRHGRGRRRRAGSPTCPDGAGRAPISRLPQSPFCHFRCSS